MLSKNPFRTFLYVVVALVLVKLCYNLGYGIVNKWLAPATPAAQPKTNARRQAEALRGLNIDPADSLEAAQPTDATQ
jgi:hypothetical protein